MKNNAVSKFGNERQDLDLSIRQFLIHVEEEIDDHEKRRSLIGDSFGDHLSWKIILLIARSNLKNHCLRVGDLALNLNCPSSLLSRIVKILANDGVVSIDESDGPSKQILNFTNTAERRIFNYFLEKYGFGATLSQNA